MMLSIAQHYVKAIIINGVCVRLVVASERRQEPVRGTRGGAGGEERLDGVGNRVQ